MITDRRHHVPALLLAAVGATALTACGAGVTDTGSGSAAGGESSRPASSTSRSGSPSPSTTGPTTGGATLPTPRPPLTTGPTTPRATSSVPAGSPGTLPPDFPLPTGARYLTGVHEDDELDAHLSITDAGAAYAFWRSALPGRRYRVGTAESFGSTAEIDFTGHGCGSGSQVAIHGTEAEVQCVLS